MKYVIWPLGVALTLLNPISGCDDSNGSSPGGAGAAATGAAATPPEFPPSAKPKPATESAIGRTVSIAQSDLTSGFNAGHLRKTLRVNNFKISSSPITRAQYDECQNAGACRKYDETACPRPSQDPAPNDTVALCVGAESATRFCEWVGGRLPELGEWMLAARGPSVRRFAWGDNAGTCQQHPGAEIERPTGNPAGPGAPSVARASCTESWTERIRVARHPAGVSPAGLQDVLLTKAELVRGDGSGQFSACTDGHCLVYGLLPGAIDSVAPLNQRAINPSDSSELKVAHEYGFRCVWSGGAR